MLFIPSQVRTEVLRRPRAYRSRSLARPCAVCGVDLVDRYRNPAKELGHLTETGVLKGLRRGSPALAGQVGGLRAPLFRGSDGRTSCRGDRGISGLKLIAFPDRRAPRDLYGLSALQEAGAINQDAILYRGPGMMSSMQRAGPLRAVLDCTEDRGFAIALSAKAEAS